MSASVSTRIKTLDMVYVAMCAIMIAVCSWISIPMLVPVTLQTFGVFLTVGVLGGKRGSLAVLTGGYIIGFLFAALVMWGMEQFLGKKRWVLILSMVLGLLVCYVFGTIWFIVVYTNNTGEVAVWTALGWCVFPYIIPDILKIVVALTVCKKLAKVISI